MIPHTDEAVRMLSQRLMVQLLPELSSEYAQSDGALIGLLLNAIADEVEAGIERRLQDIREMTAILNDADLDAPARSRLEQPLLCYTLSAVNARHDELTRLLMATHEQAESATAGTPATPVTTPAPNELTQRIWQYLARTVTRHTITAVP